MYRRFHFILMVCCLTALSCQAQRSSQDLSPKEFQKKLKSTDDVVLIDVRTDAEVKESRIPGSVQINFNSPDFKEKIVALDTTKTYMVYCRTGGRSTKAVDVMKSAGIKKVYNLKGGITAWQEKGLPLER